MPMLDHDVLRAHAQQWIDFWNARNIDGVLARFAPDARFISPVATSVVGQPVLVGTAAIREYWEQALRRAPDLHFTLIDTVCDVERQTLVVIYVATRNGAAGRAVEIMTFRDGLQIQGEALYGATTPCE